MSLWSDNEIRFLLNNIIIATIDQLVLDLIFYDIFFIF